MFTATEEKLIWLALDEAAQPGEIHNSAVKLIESLRRRGLRPEALILGSELHPPESPLEAAMAKRMPFGKHKGKPLGEIPKDYLRWCLTECDNLSVNLREAMRRVLGRRR